MEKLTDAGMLSWPLPQCEVVLAGGHFVPRSEFLLYLEGAFVRATPQ